ncbi:hypothetical protein D3C76_1065420 [compost metagenome]
MQAQVHEVAGEVFAIGPFTGGVGNHQGRVVAFEQADKCRIDEAVVADFHGMAQGLFLACLKAGVAVHMGVVLAGKGSGLLRVVGQLLEEALEQCGVEFEVGRKLPEKRSEFFLEFQDPGGEEVRQGFVDVTQTLDMGDEARRLDAEHKVLRGFGIPLGIAFWPLQGVERPIDFDAVDCP